MFISTRGRYALRVMIDLAETSNGEYVPMKTIAERQDISLKYLERILPILKKNGLVEGIQGKGGGYRLCRAPEKYPVGEILRLTEGDLAPVACLECGVHPAIDAMNVAPLECGRSSIPSLTITSMGLQSPT